jgi:hypothetical protein
VRPYPGGVLKYNPRIKSLDEYWDYEDSTMTIRPGYKIYGSWGPRAEPPEAIAARYLACTDRLKQIHPAYGNWIFSLKKKPKKFDALRDDLAEAVAANVARAEDGDPTPIYGYWATVTIP